MARFSVLPTRDFGGVVDGVETDVAILCDLPKQLLRLLERVAEAEALTVPVCKARAEGENVCQGAVDQLRVRELNVAATEKVIKRDILQVRGAHEP